LTPVDVRELPCQLDFRNCPVSEWTIGPARIRADSVTHRGPTLGFRIDDAGASVCYLPDHEPAFVGAIDDLEAEWLSGYALARDADLLLHDCQYTDGEYPAHFGWGHSSLDHALSFAERTAARRTVLFHHDPGHTDEQLDEIYEDALGRWKERCAADGSIEMAVEGADHEVVGATSASA
jgi:ribonuclease BN (tRNA processing enzyme)